MTPLARIDFQDPAFIGVLIGWVLSVTLHEFAHNLAGYLGGDVAIKHEGRLTLNPFQYVDPLMTLILPMVFLLLGGIPLPGGATYVNRAALRSRAWDSIVSAAGPAMNLLLFGLLCIPLLPAVGWINPNQDPAAWTTAQHWVGAMCLLQILCVFLNLVPIPPLDGFGIIAPFLSEQVRTKLTTPPLSTLLFFGFFMLVWQSGFIELIARLAYQIMGHELYLRAASGYTAVFHG